MEPLKTLDLDAVQTFALVATLANFTRVAEVTGTTQSAVSLKLKRLETFLGRRLVERTPRSVRLTIDGEAFLAHAKNLLEANERALAITPSASYRIRLGVSDHAAGQELPTLLARLHAADPALTLAVSIGLSNELLDAFDKGEFDGVIVRQERSRRGGESLADDAFAWFALAIRALDSARIPWCETFIGGGVAAVTAAVNAGLAVAVLARRVAPAGCIDVSRTFKLPRLPRTRVMLHSRVSDARGKAAMRVLSAVFRGMAGP
jgi:DNA-binding transcriptional LysR family regulator